ncbi:MAG: hypothetical protein KGH63_03720, partial [Candidatus Micrarchaeota archaeon]|nr:hypothetical protein [Candidatus Micrarchaeota archaeon]
VLPDGTNGSSSQVAIPTGQSANISIALDASPYVSSGKIAMTSFQVASGSQPSAMESVDVVNESSIPVLAAPAPGGASAPAAPAASVPSAPAPAAPDSTLWIGLGVLVVVLAGGYLYMSGKGKK